MLLTERRKQFLRYLVDLYQKTNLPVHYETLAKVIGVSKWTAYDMVKELEKLGYLIRDYALHPGEPGRSQVVFFPSMKAIQLFEQKRSEVINLEEWQITKTKVFQLLNNLKRFGPSETVQNFLHELSKVQTRVTFVAWFVGLLLVYLRNVGGKTESLIKKFLQNAPAGKMRLTLFVGTVFGMVVQSEGHEFDLTIAELVGRYLQSIADLSDHELGLLDDLLHEALA